MYVPPAFKIEEAEARAFLRERAFGLLVVPTRGAPFAAHVPFLVIDEPDNRVRIEMHVARANAVHDYIGANCKALLVCQGPDAYISPDWYGVPNQVPTWTYVAVHVTGMARILPQAGYLDHVDRLSKQFEERLRPKKPWTSAKMDSKRLDAMLHAIVGIAIDVEEIIGKKKLIQHKGETEHAGAVAGLRARHDPGSEAIADLIQKVIDSKS